MNMGNPRFTPLTRQCFVTFGIAINMAQFALVAGFTAVLLPQLRRPDSIIPIDLTSGSWIAAMPELAFVFGNFTVPVIMSKYGRKISNLISIVFMIIGWMANVTANSIIWLLIARFLQGLSLGISIPLGPIIVGEYTSSHHRGAFLATMSLALATGVLIVHTLGSYLTWKVTATICLIITFIDLLIAIYSPETPSWLIEQGRYEEGKAIFRWLRGDGEEDELIKMIEASEIVRESKADADISLSFAMKAQNKLTYLYRTLIKKEFYKPVFIMFHIYTIENWAGLNIISPYLLDIVDNVVGKDINIPALVITIDAQRIFFTTISVYVIKKIKRRTMLLTSMLLCVTVLLVTAVYTYAKAKNVLPFDHPAIGATLIHLHMFTIAIGSGPLPIVISGEIFPLECRSISSGISALFVTFHSFLTIKTFPYLLTTLGFCGSYCLYAGVVGYSIMVVWYFLPETKDRTLQDIEQEFKGRSLSPEELKAGQPLTSSES